MKRSMIALAVLALAGGCGLFGDGEKPTTPTVGKRIPVLSAEAAIEVDPALADIAVALPPATANDSWTQPGGNAAKDMGHLALPAQFTRAWSASIGAGSSNRARLASAPVVAGGRVYTVDTKATVRAFDARTGAEVWRADIGSAESRRGGNDFWTGEVTGNEALLFGGGVSYDNGRVYATSGIGDVVALDAATGNQLWITRPGGPLRGAPTIANENVYVTSQDNQLYALNPADGGIRWTGTGTVEQAGVFGMAAPAVAAGTIVAGFSSGELNAYRYENGRVVWQDALARTSISTSVSSLSDIDAEPVIADGRVYAIGQGGRMVATELVTGQRVWEINIAGISMPWVAGEWVFVVTDEGQLLAIARSSGKVKWMTQLPRWEDVEDKEGPLTWFGPVLAGDRLILLNSAGAIVQVTPANGAVQSTVQTGGPLSLPPVVAGGTLYILNDEGQLSAWR